MILIGDTVKSQIKRGKNRCDDDSGDDLCVSVETGSPSTDE